MIARIRNSQLVRHGALVFGGVVLASLANYIFYTLISRRAGVDTYGVVTSLISAMLVLSAPATVVQLIAARLAADLEARGDLAALRKLADTVTLWTAMAVGVIVLAGIAGREALAAFFNLSSSAPIVMATIGFGFLTVLTAQRGVLQGSHRFGDYAATQAIDGFTRVTIAVPLVTPFGAVGALGGLALSQAAAFGYALYAFGARFGKRRAPLEFDRKLIVRVISGVGLGQITFTVMFFYDVPLIKHAFDAHSAGLYAAAALVGRAVLAAISFVPTIVMPKATARAAAGQSPLPLLGAAIGIAGTIVAVSVIAAFLAPGLLVSVIAGRAYVAAAPLVLPYVAASGALALANVVAAYKMGLHQYDFVVPALIVAVLEIATFALWHPTLALAITVLLSGHVAILCATLFRLNAPIIAVGESDEATVLPGI